MLYFYPLLMWNSNSNMWNYQQHLCKDNTVYLKSIPKATCSVFTLLPTPLSRQSPGITSIVSMQTLNITLMHAFDEMYRCPTDVMICQHNAKVVDILGLPLTIWNNYLLGLNFLSISCVILGGVGWWKGWISLHGKGNRLCWICCLSESTPLPKKSATNVIVSTFIGARLRPLQILGWQSIWQVSRILVNTLLCCLT